MYNSNLKDLSRFYAKIDSFHPEVTGSCFLCTARIPGDYGKDKIISFVVDCGMFQEPKYEKYNSILDFDPKKVDFMIASHNHQDHTGKLKVACKYGYRKTIYCTTITKKLMNHALDDDFNISMTSYSKHSAGCSAEDYKMVKKCTTGVELFETFSPHENVKVTFLDNGHLLGAACILVQIFMNNDTKHSINLLFTGDYSPTSRLRDIASIPNWVKKLDINIIQEATYGETKTIDVKKVFKNNVIETMKKKKTALMLAFSQERFEEILLELTMLQRSGELDPKIPIFLDGTLAKKYFDLYKRESVNFKEHAKEFLPQNCFWVDKSTRVNLLRNCKQKIIVTTSGMGTFGPAALYLPAYLPKAENSIFLNGYMAEGTTGRKIIESCNESTSENVSVFGQSIQINADIFVTSEFSAHGKSDELLDFLKEFPNLKSVFINHGSTQAKKGYAGLVKKELGIENIHICERGTTFKLDYHGFVKKFNNVSVEISA